MRKRLHIAKPTVADSLDVFPTLNGRHEVVPLTNPIVCTHPTLLLIHTAFGGDAATVEKSI